jgi:transposase-like protein
VLVEPSKMEQRYDAVLGGIGDGFSVAEVAEAYGVSRQSVYAWVARHENGVRQNPAAVAVMLSAMGNAKSRITDTQLGIIKQDHWCRGKRAVAGQFRRIGTSAQVHQGCGDPPVGQPLPEWSEL